MRIIGLKICTQFAHKYSDSIQNEQTENKTEIV